MNSPDSPDLLSGCRAIAACLNECFGSAAFSKDSVSRLIAAGHLPVGRLGKRVIASRKRLREYLEKLARGEAR